MNDNAENMKKPSIAECVSNGHPDKVADIIADAVVDSYLQFDPEALCGIRTLVSRDLIIISGESDSFKEVKELDIEGTVRKALKDLGFDGLRETFNHETCRVINVIQHTVLDPNFYDQSVVFEQGSADQCFVVGYATNETNNLMPSASLLSRALIDRLVVVRRNLDYLRLDAKSLVSVEYREGIPRIESIVLSTEHEPGYPIKKLREDIEEKVIHLVLGRLMDQKTVVNINPIGAFENAGPYSESGLSGRKIVVDNYGSSCAVGGGAFSGKDPSKLDRSGAYYARHIAKSIVHSGIAKQCKITLAYGIGISRPLSVRVEASGSELSNSEIEHIVRENFILTPAFIIAYFGMKNLCYQEIAKKGHFGNNPPWESVRFLH